MGTSIYKAKFRSENSWCYGLSHINVYIASRGIGVEPVEIALANVNSFARPGETNRWRYSEESKIRLIKHHNEFRVSKLFKKPLRLKSLKLYNKDPH